MSERRVHLVGSYPAKAAGEAIAKALETAGSHLRCVSDGETGERKNWIVNRVESFRHHPDLTLHSDGDWSSYNSLPVFRVKRGHQFRASSLDLGHVANARENLAAFRELRAKHGLDRLSFQVGIPGDLDLSLFTFGPSGAFQKRAVFREALAKEINEIAEFGGDEILFQLEFPVELVMVARAPGPLRGLAADIMARGMVKLVEKAPPGTRFGVHLCVGDLNHKALKRMKDVGPLVALTAALVKRWPQRYPLEYVHVPIGAGDQPPPVDEGYYRSLAKLQDLPPAIRFVAGLVDEDQDFGDQLRVLRTVERTIGHQVDVSTPCGLGRRTPEAATRAVTRAVELSQS